MASSGINCKDDTVGLMENKEKVNTTFKAYNYNILLRVCYPNQYLSDYINSNHVFKFATC